MASSCLNFGSLASGGTTCECPTGLGGSTCNSLLCGNPIASASNRTQLQTSAGDKGCQGSGQCSDGFSGLDCNVCTSNSACQAAVSTYGSPANLSSVSAGTGLVPDELVCSTSPYTYTSSFMQCDVVNPTLQAVFPGTTTLKFQKNVHPEAASSKVYGPSNSTYAQLWYSATTSTFPEEQFYCAADSCQQANDTSAHLVTWSCSNLKCQCLPGSTFCGGPLNLTDVLNGLSGTLDIDCASDGTTCNFKQATLQSLFGAEGLALSGCTSGECVSTTVMQQYSSGATVSAGSNGLSGGVIAGLAVVGAILLAILALLGLGYAAQRKARSGGKRYLESQPAGLSWSNISYVLPVGKRVGLTNRLRGRRVAEMAESHSTNHLVSHEKDAELSTQKSDAHHGKVILENLSGTLPYGGLMAILGPSGAGKSTFVDILAGKRKAGHVTGSVNLVTGEGVASSVRIGYVDQADILPANLTVREALMFAANLKLPESISTAEKEERAWEVLGQLGLRDIATSRIGSEDRRGISGGERRRLSIGLELIAKPSILILDEPTSGLDSVSASKVVQVLRALAHGEVGRENSTTIVATIHQPSSQIFHAFDSVMLLSLRGTQVYFGPAKEAVQYFANKGYPCPSDWNPADHLLELATSPTVLNAIAQNGLSSPYQKDSTDGAFPREPAVEGPESHSSGSKTDAHDAYPPKLAQNGAYGHGSAVKSRNARPVTTLLTQFQVLSYREYLNLKRDWSLIVMHNAVAAIVGVFVGGLYFHVDTTISGFQNRIGSLFFLGALIAFSALSALSNLLVARSLFLRERAGSYYSPVTWMLSRVLWDIVPLRILPTLILGIITYWMVGLSPDAAHFFKFLLILVEFSAAITLWNLLLAVTVPQPGVAILVSNVINLAQLAYAGFFVNLSKIPAVLRWIQWLNPLKYALEALSVNEVSGGLLITDTLSGVKVQVNAQLIMQLLFGFKPDAYYRDVLVLFGWIGLFGILLILAVMRLREIR